MDTLFEEIITNPAEWDESGLLKVRRKVDPQGPQHDCKIGCSPNMCKGGRAEPFTVHVWLKTIVEGDELDAFLARHGTTFDRIVYVGDGSNDFCPVLHLRR